MLESLDDIAQTLVTIWVRVARPDLIGGGCDGEESGAFEEYGLFGTSLLKETIEESLHDIEVRKEGVRDATCHVCGVSGPFFRRFLTEIYCEYESALGRGKTR